MEKVSIEKKLKEYGLVLPEPTEPGGSYVSVNTRNHVAYVSIQFPILNGDFLFKGRLGEKVSTGEGRKAMELCALNVLSQIHHKIGFEAVQGLNHLDAYYQSSQNWDDAPLVVDGASNLFVNILGDKGMHSRAIFGVQKLPRDFCVGLTTSFSLAQ
ncbi:RidA family protein [Flagellimonas nanhaiensis]|uniref:RidA family protein n=1 Tax=Flagellimonas nanhaiensis TaxID=2292706 RepID=A0A371JSV7_9FLAO|nr:RidA family protein [Allomuricauda nanhaiensis]RDY60878.1 RidA family protein [Allomuricauda nanhaiensis]